MRWAIVVTMIAAAFLLAAHAGAQDEPPFLGDADCSDVVSSIDAAVTLQYDASLSASVPCPESADASVDDRINAVDATLMLQMSAGLVAGIVHESLAVEPASACDVGMSACTFDAGSEFDVSVVLSSLPRVGYVGLQTQIYNGRLDYRPTDTAEEEVVWPDGTFFVRSPGISPFPHGRIAHGASTAALPPYPDSRYNGPLVRVKLACPEEPATYTVALVSYEPGRGVGSGVLGFPAFEQTYETRMIYQSQVIGRMDIDADLDGRISEYEQDLPVSATLLINCV